LLLELLLMLQVRLDTPTSERYGKPGSKQCAQNSASDWSCLLLLIQELLLRRHLLELLRGDLWHLLWCRLWLGCAVLRRLLGCAVLRLLLGCTVLRRLLGCAVLRRLLGCAVLRLLLGCAVLRCLQQPLIVQCTLSTVNKHSGEKQSAVRCQLAKRAQIKLIPG
jgi:hypothetical protein